MTDHIHVWRVELFYDGNIYAVCMSGNCNKKLHVSDIEARLNEREEKRWNEDNEDWRGEGMIP